MNPNQRHESKIDRRTFLGVGVSTVLTGAVALPAASAAAKGSGPIASTGGLDILRVARDVPLQAQWASFGDRADSLGWAGADGTYSAALPDGRTAWLFNDTFLGPVGRNGEIRQLDPVHNVIVTSYPHSARPRQTMLRGTADAPLPSVGDAGTATSWFWNGHGIVDAEALFVFEFEQVKTSDEHFGFQWIGTSVATFSLPDLVLRDVRPVHSENEVQWGVQLIASESYTYIYGVRGGVFGKDAHLARARQGSLLGAWEFWTGTGWSTDPASSIAVAEGVGSSFGVSNVDGTWVLASSDSFLGSDIYLHTAAVLTGPFSEPVRIFTAPEGLPAADVGRDGDVYGPYNIASHPTISRRDRLVISYNINSTAITDLWSDIRRNRAQFLEITFRRS